MYHNFSTDLECQPMQTKETRYHNSGDGNSEVMALVA